jgi:hypothetical protein
MNRALVGVIMILSCFTFGNRGYPCFSVGQTLTPQSANESASPVNFPLHDESVAPSTHSPGRINGRLVEQFHQNPLSKSQSTERKKKRRRRRTKREKSLGHVFRPNGSFGAGSKSRTIHESFSF